MTTYWAHSENRVGEKHTLKVHLSSVAAMAKEFAGDQVWAEEAYLAGLLHDLGKYGDRFQLRLQGEYQGVDHWSAGAWLAARKHLAFAAALAIEGHHIGLQRMSQAGLAALNPDKLKDEHPLGLTLSEEVQATLEVRFVADGLASAFSGKSHPVVLRKPEPANVASMLDVRMLFSCLTDADFLDTEAHFNGDHGGKRFRPPGLPA